MTSLRRSWVHVTFVGALALGMHGDGTAQTVKSGVSTARPLSVMSASEFEVLRQYFRYDTRIPLEHRVVERKSERETVREKIVFRSTQGFLVSGYLEYHTETASPRPCVLLLHGWSGSKESWYKADNYISGSNVRDNLLTNGYATMALDAQCHGDRIAENDFAPINHLVDEDELNPRRGYFTQQEIYMQTVADYRRGIDCLATREDIDASRLGIVGYSMGGTESLMLSAIDNRITVAVACAVPFDSKRLSLIAPQNYAARIRDCSLLMITGKNDSMCDQGQARQLFSTVTSSGASQVFVDGGHRMSKDYVSHAVEWIVNYL